MDTLVAPDLSRKKAAKGVDKLSTSAQTPSAESESTAAKAAPQQPLVLDTSTTKEKEQSDVVGGHRSVQDSLSRPKALQISSPPPKRRRTTPTFGARPNQETPFQEEKAREIRALQKKKVPDTPLAALDRHVKSVYIRLTFYFLHNNGETLTMTGSGKRSCSSTFTKAVACRAHLKRPVQEDSPKGRFQALSK